MRPPLRLIGTIIVFTAFAAAIGGWAGIRYGLHEANSKPGLDELLHGELDLTSDQHQRIEALEAQFSMRRASLENEMRAANRDLARAIEREHAYGPRAQAAIERFHVAESSLQEETIKHVLAMRTVLKGEQLTRFDGAISTALTSD